MARGPRKTTRRSRSRGDRGARGRTTAAALPRVLVTGATGCVGAPVVRDLAEHGYTVTALDLPGSDFTPVDVTRVGCKPGDVRDTALMRELVSEADAVVNLASVMGDHARNGDVEAVNLIAAADLYNACAEAGVGHFVQLSTGAMYRADRDPRTEDATTRPYNGFERTKLAADEFLLRRCDEAGTPVTVVRPAVLVGPGRHPHAATLAAVPTLLAELTSTVPRLVGGPQISWVHVEDMARAVRLLMARDPLVSGVFNVAAPQPATLGAMIDALARTAELEGTAVDLPYPALVLRLLQPALRRGLPLVEAGLRRGFGRLVRSHGLRDALEPALGRTALRRALESRVLDTGRLAALGYEARHTDLDAAWAETVQWYRENRWLP